MNGGALTALRDKTVLCVIFENDYGRSELGSSADRRWFLEGFAQVCARVVPFWIDGLLRDAAAFRSHLLAAVAEHRPDLVFFLPFGPESDPVMLDEVRKLAPTMAWFGDDTWRFSSFSSRLAGHYTYVITTDPMSRPRYRALGVDAIVSDWAGELPSSDGEPLAEDGDYRHDVTFVGAANEVRRWFVRRLAKEGVEVECFGAGWPAGRVGAADMQRIFRESRISLNLSNSVQQDIGFVLGGPRHFARWLISKKRAEQVKARNFEIPLAGGFQLTNYVLGIERHFHIGRELAVYGSMQDCAQLVRYHLAYPEERIAMARAARQRSLGEHTFCHRLERILAAIWG